VNRVGTTPEIVVLAGTNGAGKSSVAGAALREVGGDYFNPDEVARRLRDADPELSRWEANSRAWHIGRHLLERAIEQRFRFVFETTLGGRTITGLLLKAANVGLPVRIWYVGLDSVGRHLARVRARVARGGHPIPEERIRERYDTTRENLVRLLPHLTELKLYDNSREGDPAEGVPPEPLLVLHVKEGRMLNSCPMPDVPGWARPIVQRAVQTYG
jgi:predicted ABC-type ATPase